MSDQRLEQIDKFMKLRDLNSLLWRDQDPEATIIIKELLFEFKQIRGRP